MSIPLRYATYYSVGDTLISWYGFVRGSQEANTLDDETNTLDGVILKSKSN